MIKHIVMWRLKEQAEGGSRAENATRIKELLDSLPGRVPGILELEVGVNFNDSDAAFDVSLYSAFETEAALQAYLDHPEHKRVADFIGRVRQDRVVVDYRADAVKHHEKSA